MKAVIVYPETKEMEAALEQLVHEIAFFLMETGYEDGEFSVGVGDV